VGIAGLPCAAVDIDHDGQRLLGKVLGPEQVHLQRTPPSRSELDVPDQLDTRRHLGTILRHEQHQTEGPRLHDRLHDYILPTPSVRRAGFPLFNLMTRLLVLLILFWTDGATLKEML